MKYYLSLFLWLTIFALHAQNVGIGTDQPIQPVHIVGNTFLKAGVEIANSADTSALTIVDNNFWQLSMDGNDIQSYDALFGTSSRLGIQKYGGELSLCNGAMLFQPQNNRISIPSNTRLGIGVTSPSHALDINGALQLNQNISTGQALFVNGTEALWYNGTYFSWGFGATANYFESNVGIGVSDPQSKLHVLGKIRSSVLAGNGYRPLLANPNGEIVVSAEPATKYWSINGMSFNSSHPSFTHGHAAYIFSTTTDFPMSAPVNLPHGAIISSVYFILGDLSTSDDLRARLLRVEITDGSVNAIIAEVNTTGVSGGGTSLTDNTINQPIIDNASFVYIIEVSPDIGDNWHNNLLHIRHVRIAYTMPY